MTLTDADLAALYHHTGLRPMRLMGRCSNGCQRGAGTVVHIASGQTGPALCGQREGRTSAGWADAVGEISCSRCARRLPAAVEFVLRANKEDS